LLAPSPAIETVIVIGPFQLLQSPEIEGQEDCPHPTFGAVARNSSTAIIGKMTPLALRAEKVKLFDRIASKQRVIEFVL